MTLMQKKGISTTTIEQYLDLEACDSMVFIARANTLIGYIIMTDPLRKDAQQTIKALTEIGKEVHLCTGADEKTALRYAKALGINKIYANCVATTVEKDDISKPAYIKALKKNGHKVSLIGDAANDAQAIAESDFGIAVLSKNSDELTQQQAGAIIQSDTLLPIVSAFSVSQQTVTNIKQNLLLSFGYNLISVLLAGGLLLAIGITLPPALGVLFMAIQACSIFYNVYRFKHQPLEHLQEESTKLQEVMDIESSSLDTIRRNTPKNKISLEDKPTNVLPFNKKTSGNKPTLSFWNNSDLTSSEPDTLMENTFESEIHPVS
jgi:Cu2+-exporting ATPase